MPHKTLRHQLWMILVFFLLVTSHSLACGPGRGPGKRRGPRKRTPLVFKQHIPNVSENTVGASGTYEGKITKPDSRFKEMVTNLNPNIVFRNEEENNEDRVMSKRCKDKLNTLAIAVMNEWPGVKLRVTEAWDTQGHHAPTSLHYEGRAVDITTSDRVRSRYGMLARLAVEAGFDWVYYESRSHIHCSVRSDSLDTIHFGGCFPSTGTVVIKSKGITTLDKLQVGDSVLSVDIDGKLTYSEVIAFLDTNKESTGYFHRIETENGHTIRLTGKHLIYSSFTNRTKFDFNDNDSEYEAMYADSVQIGDYVMTTDGTSRLHASRVKNIAAISEKGVVAPLTRSGTIIVDGVVVSCYAFINSDYIAHASFFLLRGLHQVTSHIPFVNWADSPLASYAIDGIHWYAKLLYKIAPLFMDRTLLYMND
ncbi:sonic hedgehog protein-like [Argonauta hians]